MKEIFKGICAGILISIGCTIYLKVNNYIGAILFSIALYMICIKGFSLYTGKIGFICQNHKKEDIKMLVVGLIGNIISVMIFGILVSYAIPDIKESAKIICESKLIDQSFWQTFIRAMMCGFLMYMAVSGYKECNSVLSIFLAVSVFILCGFEHSIANIGYFSIANCLTIESVLFIIVCIIGNSFGAILVPLMSILSNIHKK